MCTPIHKSRAPDLPEVMLEAVGRVARATRRTPRTRQLLASLIDRSVAEEAMAGNQE